MRGLSFDTLLALSSLLGLGHAFEDNAVADEIVLKIATVPVATGPTPTTPLRRRSSTSKPVSDLTTRSYGTPSSWPTGTGTAPTHTRSTVSTSSSSTAVSPPACTDHWLAKIDHQGFAPYVPSPSTYKVFRNVKDYGAKGDGESDDTEAINRAISEGGRCGPGKCDGTTISPAVVYFPPGTYLVTSPIIDYYFTQIYGNPNCMPVIKAAANFTGAWVLDGNQYQSNGLGWGSTNVFWRQVRNLVIDLTGVSSTTALVGIHWPTSQATSLQNILIKMSSANDTQQYGMLIEEGSGGYIGDMVFKGGLYGMRVGNQQFTMRNLTFVGAKTAISQLWDWGWTYSGLTIRDCDVGLDISNMDGPRISTASIVLIDSEITNTRVGIVTARQASGNNPPQGNTLIVENVRLSNVQTAIQGPSNSTLLVGTSSSTTITGWGQGTGYVGSSGPTTFQGSITPFPRPGGLTAGTDFYHRSRPQYSNLPASQFVSVRSAGAKGDGVTDDTAAINKVIAHAAASRKVVYFDYGLYVVTSTIKIPAGSRITGEGLPVILSEGEFFNNMEHPKPVVRVGKPGDEGAAVEWSDMVVSTRGQQKGAILIEWNLNSKTPSGMWDVHTRIGGFKGSNLQSAECPKTPETSINPGNLNQKCIAAFMSMHITKSAGNLYNENCWLWVADHDVEDGAHNVQITIYAGRGLLVESASGNVWLWGSGSEHHQLYQYQLARTQKIFGGQLQTETAYYQPNPDAVIPFPADARYRDPVFAAGESGWGLRVVNSTDVLVYGAGLYSFFINNNNSCAAEASAFKCQSRLTSIERSRLHMYNLNTVGVTNMVTLDGVDVVSFENQRNGFVSTVGRYTS
ncbi:hypothetical protein MAPG_01205 [Magnaporthiopsis poae ATCC 64411]|uniref:Rhamnogalacturonase A/B/Epimerase-like pectate lyase domain-containing protein n=1 Tax=Magnaporthiopsis poae (strain ATCC 64411 / 73-15) TaxID=644358 RepID=A0A0C4DN31_MAGP6|nr:hypothetical protein MAPG_01205 [Magnaporthiopsis poae ATCC 64411]